MKQTQYRSAARHSNHATQAHTQIAEDPDILLRHHPVHGARRARAGVSAGSGNAPCADPALTPIAVNDPATAAAARPPLMISRMPTPPGMRPQRGSGAAKRPGGPASEDDVVAPSYHPLTLLILQCNAGPRS